MAEIEIACRVASYRPHEGLALAHLHALGVRGVEVRLPPPEEPPSVLAQRLASFGLRAVAVHSPFHLTRDDPIAAIAAAAPVARMLSCGLIFIATYPAPLSFAEQCARLRAAAETAATEGLTIALETHPDLAANAEQALRTLARVNHPALRLNFDTANVGYYGGPLDCVAELRRVLPHVASVHLKDGSGQRDRRWFPALGDGQIDFSAVFAALDEVGFAGPATIEIDTPDDPDHSREAVLGRVARSVEHLRRIGRFPPAV